jgi:excisionase family DNA binding protein
MGKQKEDNAVKKDKLLVSEKYTLSINEAAQYFGIGINKMRRLAEENLGDFAVYSGNRYLIIRSKLEEFLQKTSSI